MDVFRTTEEAEGAIRLAVEHWGPMAVAEALEAEAKRKVEASHGGAGRMAPVGGATLPVAVAETDNWANKATFVCRTCQWYAAKEQTEGGGSVGRCRRHAPALGGYPVVWPTDWCGDHKLGNPPRF